MLLDPHKDLGNLTECFYFEKKIQLLPPKAQRWQRYQVSAEVSLPQQLGDTREEAAERGLLLQLRSCLLDRVMREDIQFTACCKRGRGVPSVCGAAQRVGGSVRCAPLIPPRVPVRDSGPGPACKVSPLSKASVQLQPKLCRSRCSYERGFQEEHF